MSTKLSRREFLHLAGGTMGVISLAACAMPMTTPSGEGAPPAEAPRSLIVAHRREYFKEMEDLFAQAVMDWGSANNVEIETTTVAAEASEDFVPKLLAQVQAGDPPNLVYHIRLIQALWSQNALEAVSDTVAAATELYGEPPYGQTSVNIVDGEWWGIPYMMHGGGTFGRRSKFEEAGFDPMSLHSYEQRRDACLAISKPAEDFYGWGVTVNSGGDATGFIEGVIQNWGGHYTNEDITEVTFNSPETVSAIEWLTELYTSDAYTSMLPPGLASWTDSSNNEAFLSGTIGYTHNAASVYAKAKADGNPIFEDTVVMGTAVGPTNTVLESGGGGQFMIPRGAANQELAKELTMHMITPPVFLPISLVSAGLFLPAYAGYYEMAEVVTAFEADPNLATMGKSAQGDHVGSSWPSLPSPLFDAIASQAVLTDMMAQITAQGMVPADAVAQAADRIVSIGQDMGFFS